MPAGADAAMKFPLPLYKVDLLAPRLPLMETDGPVSLVAVGVPPLPPKTSMLFADGPGPLAFRCETNCSRHK